MSEVIEEVGSVLRCGDVTSSVFWLVFPRHGMRPGFSDNGASVFGPGSIARCPLPRLPLLAVHNEHGLPSGGDKRKAS